MMRGLEGLVYVGILGALFTLVAYTAFSQFIRRGVTATPDLVGSDHDEAHALLADQGLLLVWSDDEARFDDEIPVDHVMAQRPRTGTLVKRGSAVTAIASRGPRRVRVPSVEGDALQAAQVTLAGAGLRVGRTVTVFSDQVREGAVVGQDPQAEALVAPGAQVDLFLSLAGTGRTYLMPDVVTLDYDRVRTFFLRNGFRLGRVSYVRYEGLVAGTVLRQFPVAGHALHAGDVISLAVAAAPPGKPLAASAAPLSAAGIPAGRATLR